MIDLKYTATGGFSADYVVEELWTNSAGLGVDITRDMNKKVSLFFDTKFVFNQYISLNIRTEKNVYNDWLSSSNNWDEFVIRGTVTTNW